MARTIRKTPLRKTRRTAERLIDWTPGPWFVPADTSNVIPLFRQADDDAGDDHEALTLAMQARFERLGGF